ncbi:Gfo/Idh/MocA family protein [Seonamhaeicola sp. ML3]|uniref:Gfo/Idh/MocA family protein n=1 Tax=Seonamhaeicola sp. ML3 TaxID=2937786 RepID=UPI00200DCA89|nr:Gfo/Idh/MocA family oxidoreductase [Seonamhaeicola sp. ML3]
MTRTRRDFIKLSSLSATAIGLGLVACNTKEDFKLAEVPDSERIKVGLIGVGNRGKSILKALEFVPEIKVSALCDTLEFQMDNAKQYISNKVETFTDFKSLLALKDIDAVIIATPLHEHYKIVMASFDADKHILCEKTLAYNIEECKEIKQRGNQSNKVFQVSYQYQLHPVFNAIKNIINQGYCGTITRIDCSWDRHSNWRRKLPSEDLERQINWRMYKEYSGGLVAELGSHLLNMVDNLLGTHPIKVLGTGGIDYWKDGRETFDNVHALFDYPNGVKVGFHSQLSNSYEGYQMKIYGDKATIISHGMKTAEIIPEGKKVDEKWKDNVDSVTGASIKIIDNDKKRKINPVKNENVIYPTDNDHFNVTWRLYKNFAAAIKGKESLLLGLKDGYQSAISVHMANEAIRNEKIVKWLPEYDV